MCSVCYKESKANPEAQTQNKTETFKLQSLLPQMIEHKKAELSENNQFKVEEQIKKVTASEPEKVEEVKPLQKEALKDRCYKCNRKTGHRGITCKCSFNFCMRCRLPEEHDCTFDHQALAKEQLGVKLNKVVGDKF